MQNLRQLKIELLKEKEFDKILSDNDLFDSIQDIKKDVIYFIGKATSFDYVPQQGEISEIRWVDIGYASTILTYENDKMIVGKARNIIKNRI